ncbi:MAG: protein-L-isoaspartate(D-aspartate) O-methyltransferase [Saprospirales bacterium]|nr:MAG: protein-L-isoaspartate(D-aspartate) O-methyltransferase [Saprospirales bacterium]
MDQMKGDNYLMRGQRRRMVEDLKNKGIKDPRILEAFGKVPRHLFISKGFEEWAYRDQAFQIDCDQTISQPYTVAIQTELLELEPGYKVLEIGTGSGYQSAILAELGAEVYSIERFSKLKDTAIDNLERAGYPQVSVFYGDGWEGLPDHGPFDRILVTAAAHETPVNLLRQLKIGGLAVIPLGKAKSTQKMYRYRRNEDGSFSRTSHGLFRFVPMLKGKT